MLMDITAGVQEMKELLQRDKLVLFAGSGISVPSKLPTWDGFIDEFIKICELYNNGLKDEYKFNKIIEDAKHRKSKDPIQTISVLRKKIIECTEKGQTIDYYIGKLQRLFMNAEANDMLELKGQLIELEPPAAPIRKRYRTNDSTIEKLGELLNENQRGILTFRDELIGLLTSWDREDRRQDRAFYLEAWNGSGSFTTDRVGRGTIDIPNCCVSILGGIQPSKLLGYLQQAINDISNDGMIQRFQLLVYPDEPQHWKLVDQWPDKAAKDTAWQIIKTLAEMDFLKAGADLMDDEVIPFFRFSSGGQAVFNEWLTELEAKIRQDDFPLMIEHLAKFRSLMPSLALIFHVVDIAGGKPPGPITEEAALMAAEWCEYLESHARRIYSIAGDVSVKAAVELTMKIKTGKIKDGFSLRDIYRNCWHLLDTKGKVEAACRELIETGWLHSESVEVSSRGSKEIFRVNPKIFTQKH